MNFAVALGLNVLILAVAVIVMRAAGAQPSLRRSLATVYALCGLAAGFSMGFVAASISSRGSDGLDVPRNLLVGLVIGLIASFVFGVRGRELSKSNRT